MSPPPREPFRCPRCGKLLGIGAFAGQIETKCPRCGEKVTVAR